MELKVHHVLATKYAGFTIRYPFILLLIIGIITVISLFSASHLEMRMNWTDLLPKGSPTVENYEDIQDRFGNAAALVVVLEGDYDRIIEMARVVEPRLKSLENLKNVQGELPLELFREHGMVLLKPNDFKRSMRIYSNSDLVGSLRGLNDDYDREYSENESNLRRDEVNVARSLLGMKKALDLLYTNLEDESNTPPITDAVDAMMLGEPWMISLDRRMLMIMCEPLADITEIDSMLATVGEVERMMDEIRPQFPDVSADLTGMAKISQDEMNSIGVYTQILALIALILIYLLLVWSFRSWSIPVITMIPLIVGIIWTMGLLYVLFGGLNLFTAMMMLVLLGLGIDFSIHLVSRFGEEIGRGTSLNDALVRMLGGTGVGVITGALTTAAAFLMLMIGDTSGVFEFGAATGLGVLLTLVAIFITLPSMLVIRQRRKDGRGFHSSLMVEGSPLIGRIARAGWNHPIYFITVAILLAVGSYWAMKHIGYEYDFLELEPKGLKSVDLQREIPKRFGLSDHASWVIAGSIEESREIKERLRKKPTVGDVMSISDYIPPEERLIEYRPLLDQFRINLDHREIPEWQPDDRQRLATEIDRLWDNMDMMSNMAFTAGLDRIVQVTDMITGTREVNGEISVDSTAILPMLSRLLEGEINDSLVASVAQGWAQRVQDNLYAMSNPAPVSLDDLPETIRMNHLPSTGDGFLVHIVSRQYMWDKALLDKFIEQTTEIAPNMTGMEQLMVLMMESTLEDGRRAALLALGVIALLLLIHFRGLTGLLALVPLACSALYMIGLMYLFGMKYNYMNLITVPIILGIGIDDGVHALHRFREEHGDATTRLYNGFRFVGRAIMLTSLTTMIGFGNVAFYEMRGMASFGIVLFMGVGICFVTTVLVLPATLRLFTRSDKIKGAAE